jgi:ParB-like chromosome segregation protein Spo0J
MLIETLDIKKLKPAAYNPRKDLKPGDPEYDKLKKSILEFDYINPIIWNKRSGNVVGGHQRLKILKEQGEKLLQVSVVDLSPDKEKVLNLALNKNSGEWDFPKLKDILEELDTGDLDIEVTGFDVDEIENLMTQFHVPDFQPEEDDSNPRLDELKPVCCPECGHEFLPKK